MTAGVDYTLLIVNAAGTQIVCDPIEVGSPSQPGYSEISLGPRHNQVGVGSFTIVPNPDLLAAVYTPENRVVAIRDAVDDQRRIVMSGPIETPTLNYQADRDGPDRAGSLTVSFADDMSLVADGALYPDPAHDSNSQTVVKYVITTQNPETAIRDLVRLNVGPDAITARQITGLTLATAGGFMSGVTVSTSFDRATLLMDAVREVVRLAGGLGLGLSVIQSGLAGVVASVYQPRDLSASVWFSRALGNLVTLDYEPAAPTCTVAIVGDATAGIGRVVHERTNSAALAAGWRRRELFVDGRSAANLGELDKAGDDALKDGGPKYKVAVVARQTPLQQFWKHFGLGDQVSVEVYDGLTITEVCTGVDIKVTPDGGEVVTPLIGDDTSVLTDAKAAELRRLYARLARIEGAL